MNNRQRINTKYIKRRETKTRFLRTRMWLDTIIDHFKDPTTGIPRDIGDNLIIKNNSIITKKGITKLVLIDNLGLETSIGLVSNLINYVKESTPGATVDVNIASSPIRYDVYNSTNRNSYDFWKDNMVNPKFTPFEQKMYANMCYTYEKIKSGADVRSNTMVVVVRASNIEIVNAAVNSVSRFLMENEIKFSLVKSNMASYVSAITPTALDTKIKGSIQPIWLESRSLAELFPSNPGLVDQDGVFLGLNKDLKTPYYVDFKGTSNAKNIYVLAPSGSGKTFLVQSWLNDCYLQNYRILITDIKGKEFLPFTKSTNGVSISMNASSSVFINTLRLNRRDIVNSPREYFEEKVRLSKTMLSLIVNPDEEDEQKVSSFLERLLHSYYLSLGVEKLNPNTWIRTNRCNPYDLFDFFNTQFISNDLRDEFGDLLLTIMDSLSIYLSEDGSGSELFKNEADLPTIRNARVVHFNYGNLSSNRSKNVVLQNLMDFYVQLITDDFIAHAKSLGDFTVIVNEEAQLTSKHIKHMYAENISLRRAQNAVTIILGNSIAGTKDDIDSKIILDNINIWVLGKLLESNLKELCENHGMSEYEDMLRLLTENKNQEYNNTFLIINNVSKDTVPCFLKAYVPDSVLESEQFTTVDVRKTKTKFKISDYIRR